MIKLENKIYIILCLIFIFALTVRLFRLGTNPESLTWDETALGYNAYSILKTGADEYGVKFPLILRSFNDFKPALYAYLSIPFIYIFGLNIFSVRLLSAIAGSSLVISIYYLTKNFTNSQKSSLIAAILISVCPLLLLYSRMALEANLSLALFIAGAAFITHQKYRPSTYITGLVLLILSAYAYHNARYVAPIFLILTLPVSLKKEIIIKKIKFWPIALLLYLPIIYFVFNPQYNIRFKQTSVLANYQALYGSFANLNDTPSPIKIISQIYLYSGDVVGRIIGYINPYQLFVQTGGHPSYRLEHSGIFNLIELPFFIIGGYLLIKNFRRFYPLIILIFVAILPAALTIDWFIALRALLLWPLIILVSAIGISWFIDRYQKKLLIVLLFLGMWLYEAGRTLETVIVYHPYVNAGAYQYGFAQMVPFVNQIKNKYDQVIIESPHAQPYIFFLFYSQFPPREYQEINKNRRIDFENRSNYDFGPFTFRKIYFPDDRKQKNTLFIGNVFSLPSNQIQESNNIEFVKDFSAPNGDIFFRVVGTKP
jgi:4-amino-4-deoxy-L-arabinose transferase-like glycosyltransferase